MLKKYTEVNKFNPSIVEPKIQTLNAILNYSKSLKVKEINGVKTLVNFN
jgi:hypothetical protein